MIVTGFDGLYGQDPYAYYNYSLDLLAALRSFQPLPPFFWPLGYPLPVALVVAVIGARPLAGQLVSLVAIGIAAVFVYALVHETATGSRWPGFIAGALAGVSAQAMISGMSVMSDAAGLAWVTLSSWALARYVRRLSLSWLLLAAFALGWAVLTRWVYALAAVPWSLSVLLSWRGSALRIRERLLTAGMAALIGAGVVGSQFVFVLRRDAGSFTGDLQVVGWDPANAFRSTITNPDGVFHYERPIGLYYALAVVHPAFVFPAFAPFLLLGVWRLRTLAAPMVVLLAGWPLTVYLFLAGIAWENPRFSLAFFPPLLVLTGVGLDFVWKRWPAWRSAVLVWCVLGLAGSLLWSVRDVRVFVNRKQADLTAVQWAATRIPPGSTVLSFGLSLTLEHYTQLRVVDLYAQSPASVQALICSSPETYLLVDPANLESQWTGKSPEVNFRWLKEAARLFEIGSLDPWMLYGVGMEGCSSQ